MPFWKSPLCGAQQVEPGYVRTVQVPRANLSKGAQFVDQTISQHRTGFLMFSKSTCPACVRAKKAIRSRGLPLHVINMSEMDHTTMNQCQDYLLAKTGARTVPRVFFNGSFMGGSSDVMEKLAKNGDAIARSCFHLPQPRRRQTSGDVPSSRQHHQAGLRVPRTRPVDIARHKRAQEVHGHTASYVAGAHLSVPHQSRRLSVPSPYSSPRGSRHASPQSSPYASPRSSPYHSPQSSRHASPQTSPYASPRGVIRPRTHRVSAVQHHRHSPSPSPSPIPWGFDPIDVLERETVNSCPPTPPASAASSRSSASEVTSRGSAASRGVSTAFPFPASSSLTRGSGSTRSRGSAASSRGSGVTSRGSSTAFPFPEENDEKAVTVYVEASQEKSEHCLPAPAYGRTPKKHTTPKGGVVCEGGVCYISPRR